MLRSHFAPNEPQHPNTLGSRSQDGMAILFPPYQQFWIVHMIISFLGSTRLSSSSSSKIITFVSAFAVQQRQRSSLKPARHTRHRTGNCLPVPINHCRDDFCSPSRCSVRLMSHSSHNRPQRPELVVSVKDYLQDTTAGSTIHTNPANGGTGTLAANIQLVLASASPRRREILDMMGLQNKYVVIPSPLNESQLQAELRTNDQIDPILYTRTLAEQKAYAVAYDMLSQQSALSSELPVSTNNNNNNNVDFHHPVSRLILGSDTVVAITDMSTNITTVLEKPVDTNDAIRMLQQLQNKSHVVYTGVAIVKWTASSPQSTSSSTTTTPPESREYFRDNQPPTIQLVRSFVETATVHISAMNDIDIQSYVDTTEPMDKAGAYGIQGIGGQIVTKINGDFFTVCVVILVILPF